MRIPQVLVPLLSLLAAACISLPDIEPGPPSGDGGVSADGGSDGGTTSDGGIDQTAPTLVRTVPPNSATRVPLDSSVAIDFSEELITSTLRLSSTPPVSFSLSSWTPEAHRAVFSASSPFAQDTAYTVSVEGQDLAGNALSGTHSFTFTTVGPAPDTTPPTLVDSSPSDGAIGAPREGSITLTFSEPMNKASVESAFFIAVSSTSIAGSFSWNPAGTQAVFDPNTDFAYGTTVQWSLTNGATDLAGNTLSSTSRTFRVVREFTAVLSRENGNQGLIYDINTSSNSATWPIGDDSQNKTFRAGTSFMLYALDSQLTRITGATLSWPYINSCGTNCNPFLSLGSFVIEPIYYGDSFVPPNVWNTPPIGTPLRIDSENALGIDYFGYCRVSVLPMVVDAWTNRASHSMRAQFRLRFETLTNNDSSADNLEIREPDLNLVITYEYP
jgi:hypothetical protein